MTITVWAKDFIFVGAAIQRSGTVGKGYLNGIVSWYKCMVIATELIWLHYGESWTKVIINCTHTELLLRILEQQGKFMLHCKSRWPARPVFLSAFWAIIVQPWGSTYLYTVECSQIMITVATPVYFLCHGPHPQTDLMYWASWRPVSFNSTSFP